MLGGQLTFRVEHEGEVHTLVAGTGDAVSIPKGIGHSFSVTSAEPARYLIATTPAGLEAFFADAGEQLDQPELTSDPPDFDRQRLLAAFTTHDLTPYEFPVKQHTPTP